MGSSIGDPVKLQTAGPDPMGRPPGTRGDLHNRIPHLTLCETQQVSFKYEPRAALSWRFFKRASLTSPLLTIILATLSIAMLSPLVRPDSPSTCNATGKKEDRARNCAQWEL